MEMYGQIKGNFLNIITIHIKYNPKATFVSEENPYKERYHNQGTCVIDSRIYLNVFLYCMIHSCKYLLVFMSLSYNLTTLASVFNNIIICLLLCYIQPLIIILT